MFKLSEERNVEISRKAIVSKDYKEKQEELEKVSDYILEQIREKALFEKFEQLNNELLSLSEEIYYKEGFKDGVSLYNDKH